MKKIKTLFERDPDVRRYVLPQVTPGCEWVLAGEGVATRMFDGTCVLLDPEGGWWARREVKPGGTPPAGWWKVDHDDVTGKSVGWEPIGSSPFARFFAEALANLPASDEAQPGTHELIGPKINGNPEQVPTHLLIAHRDADILPAPRDYEGLRAWLSAQPYEGVVWHHPDGRMVKLKRRDLRR